jgi:class 3 adenylate cyclase/PAS domain-containing protein
MFTTTTGSVNSLSAQLAHLSTQVRETAAALLRHEGLTSLRDVHLPSGTLDAVESLQRDLIDLVDALGENDRELEQLRALAMTSALINSSLDVDTVLSKAMAELIDLINAERGFIVMAENSDSSLEFRIARGINDLEAQDSEVSRTIVRRVLNSGQPLLSDNAMEEQLLSDSETIHKFALRSIMCVPLIFRNRVSGSERIGGAIYVDNKFKQAVFSERELNLLTAFANQAAVAIENAILYHQVEETMREINRARLVIENVFTAMDSGVMTTDYDGAVTLINRAGQDMLHVQAHQIIGQPLSHALPLSDEAERQIRAARQTGQSLSLEAQSDIAGRGRAILNVRVSPLQSGDGSMQGAAMLVDDLTEERERDDMLDTFSRYLSSDMVKNIHQISKLATGGERRELTCVFISACNFTDFPPHQLPQQQMELLNIFLNTATQAVHSVGGIVDKYLGNEMMVLFNTQLNPDPYHAHHAVEMALLMRQAFAGVYTQLSMNGELPTYTMAIHTGIATLGNVGSLRRRSFTALGDTINTTKRVQDTAQAGQILVTGEAYDHLQATSPNLRDIRLVPLPSITLRGKKRETRLFEVAHVR